MKILLPVIFLVMALPSFATVEEQLARLNQGYDKEVRSKVVDEKRSFKLCKMNIVEVTSKDPILNQDRNLLIKDYLPYKSKKNSKTILLLPPTGGENILDNIYANHFCARGFRVVLLTSWDYQLEASLDPAMHDKGAIRAAAAIRNAVDFIAPKTNTEVGILGTSVGAISSAMSFAVDNRIGAGFFIVGGGGMSEIIAESTEQNLSALREKRLAHFGLKNIDEYRTFLSDKITIEPLDFAEYVNERPAGFVIAESDITVPTKNQLRLADAYKGKTLIHQEGDHVKVIVRTSRTLKNEIAAFFLENLK